MVPRNNLSEHLAKARGGSSASLGAGAAAGATTTTAGNGNGNGTNARKQGLAREMSGFANHANTSKSAFVFARESGAASVSNASKSAAAAALQRQSSFTAGNGNGFAPSRPGVSTPVQGRNVAVVAPSSSKIASVKGKERAIPNHTVGPEYDVAFDDSGFAEVSMEDARSRPPPQQRYQQPQQAAPSPANKTQVESLKTKLAVLQDYLMEAVEADDGTCSLGLSSKQLSTQIRALKTQITELEAQPSQQPTKSTFFAPPAQPPAGQAIVRPVNVVNAAGITGLPQPSTSRAPVSISSTSSGGGAAQIRLAQQPLPRQQASTSTSRALPPAQRAAVLQAPAKVSSTYDDMLDELHDSDIEELDRVAQGQPTKGKPDTRPGRGPLQMTTSANALAAGQARQQQYQHQQHQQGMPAAPHRPLNATKPNLHAANNALAQRAPAQKQPARTLPAAAAELEQHPWSKDVRKALTMRFKLPDFRPNQLKAINGTLSGKDVFVLMPTGGGKSLCYQLPAVISSGTTRGVTVVVSPLISLILDQVTALLQKDITVVTLNSTMDAEKRRFSVTQLKEDPPTCSLVYVTPEMIEASGQFKDILQSLYQRKQLARFVIDEAHCVSQWGHDLRPSYKQLGNLKQLFPTIPMIALTATANPRVQQDILTNLKIPNAIKLSQSFNRTNLYYEIRPKGSLALKDVATFIQQEHRNECGIVYCLSRRGCEETADKLRANHSINAAHYHANMDKDDKQRVQLAWQKGDIKIICATIAFGMGIDKPDVRFVVHYNLPSSLEGYYQETGRAGRDGLPSVCVLYYNFGDIRLHDRFIDDDKNASWEQKMCRRNNLNAVLKYCTNISDCRRTQVLHYFGEKFQAKDCNLSCDTCKLYNGAEVPKVDMTPRVKELVELVRATQDSMVTITQVSDIFRGLKPKRLVDKGLDQATGAGKGRDMSKRDVERLIQIMYAEKLLDESLVTNAMGFTAAYVKLRTGANFNLRIEMAMSRAPASRSSDKAQPAKKGRALAGIKPKRAGGRQAFVEDEQEDAIEASWEQEEEDDDTSETIASTSTRSNSTNRKREGPLLRASHYGDETDDSYEAESDGGNETDSTTATEGGQDDDDDDDIELVQQQQSRPQRGKAPQKQRNREATIVPDDNSDIEFVGQEATPKVEKRSAKKTPPRSAERDEGTTQAIFGALAEYVAEAAQAEGTEYPPEFEDSLWEIAEKRCNSYPEFLKIEGWDETLYDKFGPPMKDIIHNQLRFSQRAKDRAQRKLGKAAATSASATKAPSSKDSNKRKANKISSYFPQNDADEEIVEQPATKKKKTASTKKTAGEPKKKKTSKISKEELRERFTSQPPLKAGATKSTGIRKSSGIRPMSVKN